MKNKLIGGVLLSAMALSLLAGCGPKPTIGDPEPAPKPDHGYVEIPKMDENNISPDEERPFKRRLPLAGSGSAGGLCHRRLLRAGGFVGRLQRG